VNSDCASTYCDVSNTHTCVNLGALNDACTNVLGAGSGPPCQFGLFCPTYSTGAPTCVMPKLQTAVHGACDPLQGAASATPACGTGLYCQVQYSNGATCTGAANDCTPPSSPFGSFCDVANGVCKVPSGGQCEMKLAAGTDCDLNNESFFSSIDSQCADGTTCVQMQGQTKTSCQALLSAGGDCARDAQCKTGLGCVGGKCTAWASDGMTCGMPATDKLCASRACIPANADAGGVATCEAIRSFGQSCVPTFEDGLCAAADLPGTSSCVANGSGSGTCAPKCF
jgi:hypothetical protein